MEPLKFTCEKLGSAPFRGQLNKQNGFKIISDVIINTTSR